MTLAHLTRLHDAESLEWIGGSVHHVLLDGAATDGTLAAFRSEMANGAGSPVHVHAHDDETVFVLSGEATFWVGHDVWRLRSGDVAFLPRGLPHTYTVTSEGCELISVCAPSGMEDFFREGGRDMSEPRPDNWQLDLEALQAAAAAAGQTILGGPLRPGDRMPDSVFSALGALDTLGSLSG